MNDNNNLNQQVIDKMTKVCICRAISRAKIKEAIKNGAHTVEAVAEKTGATKGTLFYFYIIFILYWKLKK